MRVYLTALEYVTLREGQDPPLQEKGPVALNNRPFHIYSVFVRTAPQMPEITAITAKAAVNSML